MATGSSAQIWRVWLWSELWNRRAMLVWVFNWVMKKVGIVWIAGYRTLGFSWTSRGYSYPQLVNEYSMCRLFLILIIKKT